MGAVAGTASFRAPALGCEKRAVGPHAQAGIWRNPVSRQFAACGFSPRCFQIPRVAPSLPCELHGAGARSRRAGCGSLCSGGHLEMSLCPRQTHGLASSSSLLVVWLSSLPRPFRAFIAGGRSCETEQVSCAPGARRVRVFRHRCVNLPLRAAPESPRLGLSGTHFLGLHAPLRFGDFHARELAGPQAPNARQQLSENRPLRATQIPPGAEIATSVTQGGEIQPNHL